MTEVQKSLLVLLKEIDGICQKYKINYYLGGGTFIGAIRHGGFLPWDDDADIHMSRADADRFVEAVRKENIPDRVVYHDNEGNGPIAWRYQSTATTMFLRSLVGTEVPKGQFVDILVNYPMSDNERTRKKSIDNYLAYTELKLNNGPIFSLRSKSVLRKYYHWSRMQKLFGSRKILRRFAKKEFYFSEDEAEYYLVKTTVAAPDQFVVPKWVWGTPRYVPFEDTMLPIAEWGEKQLSNAFGPAWFELPAYVERESHVAAFDMEVPFSVYESDIDHHLNVPRFYRAQIQKKQKWFRVVWDRNLSMPRVRQLQGIGTCMELERNIEKLGLDLKAMIERGEKKELEELFAPYITKATSMSVKYYDVYLDMPDEYLYAALYFRCFDGNYGLAKKILNQRRTRVERELPPELRRLCDICDATDEMLTALYGDLNMDRTRELVDEWLAKEPTALYFQRADMNLRLSCDRRGESAEELLRRCEGYLEQYPDDGELLKYKGDILRELGSVQEGEKCYKMALCNIKNGMVIKAVKEYFALREAQKSA